MAKDPKKTKQQTLTPTEKLVADALRAGKTAASIAADRDVSEQSVYNHMAKIRAKGHDIPRGKDGDGSGPRAQDDTPPSTPRSNNGHARDDDLDLLASLSAPIAQDVTALLDGLKKRRDELDDEARGARQLILDTEALVEDLEGRTQRLNDRIKEASVAAEAVKPLVVS